MRCTALLSGKRVGDKGGENALSKESCAKTFGGRTGLSSLSNNFRQFSLWVVAKSRLGPMKNPTAVWYEQARPAICRVFRDCCAILGLLRRPPPDSLGLITKHGCSPRDRNDGGLPTSMLRQQHSRINKSDRIELVLVSGHLLCCGVFLEHATTPALSSQQAEAISIDKSSNIARQKSLHSFL